MIILGIDLGTTNSACAVWRDGKSQLIPNRLGDYMTPSVVGMDENGEILVGKSARQRLISHPAKTVSVFKRYMGSDHQVSLARKTFNAPELSALVLRSLKEDAETHLGEPVHEAVISVPAYFNDIQRKATKLAGELAGLKVERLINEPTAAAMAYGLHERPDGARFIVLDLGGGTFDVSVMEYFDGVLEVHASAGDNHLGGEDFLEILVQDFLQQTGLDKEKLRAPALQHVYAELESVKCRLSTQSEVELPLILPEQRAPWRVTREHFEALVQPLLHRVQVPIERALRDANIRPAELSDVVLVGGATRMQAFRSLVARMFRRMPTAKLDPDLVVAVGAGIQAGLKAQDQALDDIVLTDVCPYTLGVEVHNPNDHGQQGGLFLPIIERNSVVPVSIVKTLQTVKDNQTEVSVKVFQGEGRLVKQNIFLGELSAKVPKAPAGKESIDVRYSYDMNGLLEVDVTVCSTQTRYNMAIENAPGRLTPDEIAQSRKKLAALKFHPRETEENRLLLARAERLYESSLGEAREHISSLISQYESVLERQDVNEIKKARKSFEELLRRFESPGWLE